MLLANKPRFLSIITVFKLCIQTTQKKQIFTICNKKSKTKNHSTDKMHNPEKNLSQHPPGRQNVSGSWYYKHEIFFKSTSFKSGEKKIMKYTTKINWWLNETEPTLLTCVYRYIKLQLHSGCLVSPLMWNVVAPYRFSLHCHLVGF